jgi:hypothetical protein
VTGRLRRTWRRYPRRTWLIWALGAVALLGSQALFWDPGLVLLLVDPELLALIATSALALTATRIGAVLLACPRCPGHGSGPQFPRLRRSGATRPACRTTTSRTADLGVGVRR